MSQDDLAVYLRLTPEFGGTRFGPFEGLEIRLGSDPDRCHIVIPETLGVLPEHLRVIRQGPANLIFTPAERAATVYLWKQGARRPVQVQTPTAVRPGDAVALVTPDGPRFIVELDELPEEVKAQREEAAKRKGVGRSRLSADSMKSEVKRQAWTTLLTKGPMQLVQKAVTFVKSGAIYQPRNIILGVTLLGGYVFGAATLCSGKRTRSDLATSQVRVDDCQSQLAYCQGSDPEDPESQAFHRLVGAIVRETKVGSALERDDILREKVKKRAKIYLSDPSQFSWITERTGRKAQDFIAWRKALEQSDKIDNETKALALWLAANPKRARDEFDSIIDSEGNDACTRGTLRLTWWQARNLGIETALDAFHRGSAEAVREDKERETLLKETLGIVGESELPENFETGIQALGQGERQHCIYLTDSDDRSRNGQLIRHMERMMGADANGVPPSGSTYAPTARIARFFAADLKRTGYDDKGKTLLDLTFPDQTQPSIVLGDQAAPGEWALTQAADTIALAIVVPCLLRLEATKDQQKKILGSEEAAPSPFNCLVLNWRLTRGED